MEEATSTVVDRDLHSLSIEDHFGTLREEDDPNGTYLWFIDIHPQSAGGRFGTRQLRVPLADFDEEEIAQKLIPGQYQARLKKSGEKVNRAMRSFNVGNSFREPALPSNPTPAPAPAPVYSPAPVAAGDGGMMAAILTTMMQGMQAQMAAAQAQNQTLLASILERSSRKDEKSALEQLVELDAMLERRASSRGKDDSDETLSVLASTIGSALLAAKNQPQQPQQPKQAQQPAPAQNPAQPAQALPAAPTPPPRLAPAPGSPQAVLDAVGGVLLSLSRLDGGAVPSVELAGIAADAIASLLEAHDFGVAELVGLVDPSMDDRAISAMFPGVGAVFVRLVFDELRVIAGVNHETDDTDSGLDFDSNGGIPGGAGDDGESEGG